MRYDEDGMSDPFDAVTPIGERRPPVSGLSHRENRMRSVGNHAEAPEVATLRTTDPATGQPRDPGRSTPGRKKRLRPSLTTDELKAMAEQVIKRMHRIVMTPDEIEVVDKDGTRKTVKSGVREADRKHAATAMAIMIDKHTMLSGKPTQIHEVRGEDRPGMLNLARRLLGDGVA